MPILQVTTTSENYINDYMQLSTGWLDITEIELKVLVEFVRQYEVICGSSLNEEQKWNYVFSSKTRKIVQATLGFKDRANIDQYIKRLKDKKIINFLEGKKTLSINRNLMPKEDATFGIKFTIQQ